MVKDEWLTKAEAAALLGVSTKTLERKESAGEIVGEIRAGARWYRRQDVEQLAGKSDNSVRRARAEATGGSVHLCTGVVSEPTTIL